MPESVASQDNRLIPQWGSHDGHFVCQVEDRLCMEKKSEEGRAVKAVEDTTLGNCFLGKEMHMEVYKSMFLKLCLIIFGNVFVCSRRSITVWRSSWMRLLRQSVDTLTGVVRDKRHSEMRDCRMACRDLPDSGHGRIMLAEVLGRVCFHHWESWLINILATP